MTCRRPKNPAPRRPRRREILPGDVPPHEEDSFPIVGIGASAGGLEAFEQFFAAVPPGSGLAFVVVQHLDPTKTGMLPELLQRMTPMPVVEVTETGWPSSPTRVYVIPPDRDLTVERGRLRLLEPHGPRGPAPARSTSSSAPSPTTSGTRPSAVVLSGMGTDGTLGLRAIKEQGGLVLVQDPASRQFDGMPQSAIATGLADFVAPAGELPADPAFVRHLPIARARGAGRRARGRRATAPRS